MVDLMNTWYTSDTHFNHKNIIKYCNRPFSSTEEMNETIVQNWNNTVKKSDTIYHLGDVSFGYFPINRLNGKKYLLIGNHDYNLNNMDIWFDIINRDILVDKQRELVLCHYPIKDWPYKFHGWLHLHGHSHGTVNGYSKNAIDVGVDCWDFTPVHLDELNKLRVSKYGME